MRNFVREYRYYLIVVLVLLIAIGFVETGKRQTHSAAREAPLTPILRSAVITAPTIAPTPTTQVAATNAPLPPQATAEPQGAIYSVQRIAPTAEPCDPSPCGTIIYVTPVVLRDPALERPTMVVPCNYYGDWRDTDPMYVHPDCIDK